MFLVKHVALGLIEVHGRVGEGVDDRIVRFGAGYIGCTRYLLDEVISPSLVRPYSCNGTGTGHVAIRKAHIRFVGSESGAQLDA